MNHRLLPSPAQTVVGTAIRAARAVHPSRRPWGRVRSPLRTALVALLAVGAAACGGSDGPEAEVVELTSMSGTAIQGQATVTSWRGEVRISLAVEGLAGPSTLRLWIMPGSCPEDTGPPQPMDPSDPSAQPGPVEPEVTPLARLQVTTEGVAGAGTLTFPAADLPAGGDVAIVVRDFSGTPLACGEASGIPVTEVPEGAAPPAEPETPAAPDTTGDSPVVDSGVSA